MKFITETFLFLAFMYVIMYILFSFGNGSFDFTTWVKDSQEALAVSCGMITLITLFVQAFRHFDI
jgi:fumarate reductase subunit C